ncbi:hypothetical protein Tco_1269820 [Tanacetum coccineum]
MGIAQTIVENNDSPPQDKARANIFLRKHIDDRLKFEYLTTEDPSILWKDLTDHFDNQREVLLPDMLEKTYSTFHASNMTLQQQYRLQKFTRYSELNAYLLVVEQNNELLMKNHQSRPIGSLAYPEVNATKNDPKSFMRGQGQSHEKAVFNLAKTIFMAIIVLFIRTGKTVEFILMVADSLVAKSCRTAPHLCELYQASLKENDGEVNLVDQVDFENNDLDTSNFLSGDTELNTQDFFSDLEI